MKNYLFNLIKDHYYASTVVCLFVMSLLFFINYFAWHITVILMMSCFCLMLLFLNFKIEKVDGKKFFVSFFLILGLCFFYSYHVIINAYHKNTSINEILKVEDDAQMYFSDSERAIILFRTEHDKNPLILYSDDLSEYESLKKRINNGEIKVVKKRIKHWYEEEIVIGYYIEGKKFR